MENKNNTLDTRELATGKDGRLFVEFDGKQTFLAEINTFSVTMNVNAVEKQPVGSILVHSVPTGVSYTLTLTEMVIRDDVIMAPLIKAIHEGKLPVYNFQGVIYKPDGQEERMSFNNAVPNGSFGIMTLTPGEVVEREQNFSLNAIPKFISTIASTYLS